MTSFTFLLLSMLLHLATPALAVDVRSTALTPSKFGLCGALVRHTCIGSKFGASCSKFDICGPQSDSFFSGKGCQPKYGVCGPVSSKSTKTGSSTSATKTGSSTSSTRTASSTSSTAAGASPIPTSTYKGGIVPLPAGTAVAIRNPSFESSTSGSARRSRIEGRQSAGEVAASTTGWTLSTCNGGAGTCFFENYDAADGIWAFSAANGGTIYQDDVLLTIGATYSFTWYWKTVVPSGQTTVQGVFLSTNAYSDTSDCYTVGMPAIGIVANGQWAEQTITGEVDCNTANEYGINNGNGTATFRMFINGEACPQGTPCYNDATPSPTYTWYVDEIRVQQVATPTPGFTC